MDVVGSSILSAILKVVFDRLASRELLNLFWKRKQDHRLLKKLERDLLAVQVVLDDAENKQARVASVRKWLDGLQDAVYRAEDLVDEINTEAVRIKLEYEYQSTTTHVSTSTYSSNFIKPCFGQARAGRRPRRNYLSNKFLKEIMPKMEQILETLDGFIKKIEILGLEKGELEQLPFRLPSTSLVDETAVYGRDADKENIIQMLLSDGENGEHVTVIPVVGLGGIGKTTLAQLVYNDHRMCTHFDTKAWVCVSDEYDAIRIMKALLGELNILDFDPNSTFDPLQVNNLNYLQIKLQKGLTEKKFLLVLDDVWNRSYMDWETLSSLFKGGSRGSKIMVTTRDENVALMMQHGSIYRLNFLSEQDCWSLFEKHAFGNRIAVGNSEFEVIGKDIVKKCKGLPLAVKALGGLLRSKLTVEEWDSILRSDAWNLLDNQNDILPALKLSYNNLPSHLKRCFAFCAVFHKGYAFRRQEVILLWIANDLLEHPRNNERIEDIGDAYFHELRSRSFFQQSTDGKFSMHDLVNDLAKLVSGKYYLRLEDHQKNDTLDGVRHFSYLSNGYDAFGKFEPLNEAKCLRTFLSIPRAEYKQKISKKFLLDVLPTFGSLRILSLSYYKITKLPNSIGKLKQLRFLELSFTEIKELPHWLCAMYNLQTLLLSNCVHLKDLPADLSKLTNLRHLDVSGVPLTKMPMHMGKLRHLQLLTTFIASSGGGSSIQELGSLCNLHGKLTISGLQNVLDVKEALVANMKGKRHIKELTLSWSGDTNDSQVALDVLGHLQPHFSIENLKIDGYHGVRFPDWLGDPSFCHIASLRLDCCEECSYLPALGKLPSLKSLTICGMSKISKVGEDVYGHSSVTEPFQSLKVLKFENMKEWKEWHVPENGIFSSLQELYIIDCPNLIGEFPKQIPSLVMLEISGCPHLVTLGGRMCIFNTQMDLFLQFSSLKTLKISKMANLEELSSDLNNLTSLENVKIEDCPSIMSFPLDSLPAGLKIFTVGNCGNLELQPQEMTENSHVSIEELSITSACDSLKDLSLGWFPKLHDLSIIECRNVEALSIPLRNQILASLRHLEIWGCDNFVSFPEGGLPAPNLREILLYNCVKLESLPERMKALLPSLQSLQISYCPEIECFPEGGLPDSLETLHISSCEKLVTRRSEWHLQRLPYLRDLTICSTEEQSLLPEDWLLPCTLRVLRLWWHKDLKMLNYRGLQHLTSLETLEIFNCPNLQSLPKEGLPASLLQLQIDDCPLLESCLEWEKGKDWPKIAQVPCVVVKDELMP